MPKEHHEGYVNSNGTLKDVQVPQSCVECTEVILRTHKDPKYTFTRGGLPPTKHRPPIYFVLKDGEVDVSENQADALFALAEKHDSLYKEDDMLSKLEIGQGIAFVNGGTRKKANNTAFNMHFLAVLKKGGEEVTLSNVSEPDTWNQISTTNLATVKSTTVQALRKKLGVPYTNSRSYKVGRVELRPCVPKKGSQSG